MMSWRDDSPPPRGLADRRLMWGDPRSPPRRNLYDPRDGRGPDYDFPSLAVENLRRHFQRTDPTRWDWDEGMTQDRTWEDRDPDHFMRNYDQERNRRPETVPSSNRERNRRTETVLSSNRERNRRTETALSSNQERNRRPEATSSNNREKDRKRETPSSHNLEKGRKSETTPGRKPDVQEKPQKAKTTPSTDPEKQKKTEPTPSTDPEKQKKTEPTPSTDPEKQKKTEPTPSTDPEKQKKTEPTQSTDPEKQKKPEPTPSNVPKKPDPPQSLVQGVVPEHIRKSVYVLKDYLTIKDREPVIGLEYILEYRVHVREGRVDIKYFCELCEMDSCVVPMLDHVCGFKHRKLYVAKAYPFVLKALFNTKEDRALFMRRMATEIEEEEGIKMYKSDPVLRMVPMMNVKSTEAKQSKRKTRWDTEGQKQKKMRQALKFLNSFVIDGEEEAAAVTRLLQKVTSVVKFHTDRLKEHALFPLKVARAKNVATTVVKNAIRARLAEQNIFPLLELGNISLHTLGRPLHPNKPFRPPNAAFPQRPQESPFFHLNQNPQMPGLGQDNSDLEIEETDEDIEFFKQLIALLDLLPDSPTTTNSSKMDSEILMLQSFLLHNNADLDNSPANQVMQAGPLTRDLASMENVSLYQQLNRSASNTPAATAQFNPNLSMPVASVPQNATLVENADQNLLMQMVELIQSRKPNVNASLPENQNLPNRECIERVNSSAVIMDQTAHRQLYMEQQPEFVSTSRSKEEFGFERLRAGKYGNTNKRQYGANHDDYGPEQAPFSRASLPPSIQISENKRFQDLGYERDLRQDYRSQDARANYSGLSSRSFDDPAWADRDFDMPYGKRAKLDSDFSTTRNTDWGECYPDEGGSTDTGMPNLSADLLKMIRGKDLFTVSAILSEYTESNPYN